MRQLCFALEILGLGLCLGCGNNGQIVVPKGNFSNASLSGSYVYQIVGKEFVTNNNATGLPYREAGVFAADGNGNVTSGTDDFVEGSGGPSTASVTGTYTIRNDGIGTVSLSTGANFFVTLVSASKAYLIEADPFFNASGLIEKQDAASISRVPSGAFAFHMHTLNASLIPSARVGAITITSGFVTGNEDMNNNGSSTTPVISSGAFAAPTSGRGDVSINDGSAAVNFKYYIVDANNIRFLASDSGVLGAGSAEKQNGALALSGSFAFGSKGDTSNFGIGGVNSVGRFTSDGVSAINSGLLDSVQDGNQTISASFTGSFAPVEPNGRTVLSLAGSAIGSVTEVVFLVSPSRGFFLINDPNKVEDGTLDLQQMSMFSNSSLKGQFAFVTDGFDTNLDFIDRVGTMNWDGSGNMTFHEAVNSGVSGGVGGQLLGFFPASYSVASSGRATATISNVSLNNNDFVFYLVSGNDAYVLENDTGVEISGVASRQR